MSTVSSSKQSRSQSPARTRHDRSLATAGLPRTRRRPSTLCLPCCCLSHCVPWAAVVSLSLRPSALLLPSTTVPFPAGKEEQETRARQPQGRCSAVHTVTCTAVPCAPLAPASCPQPHRPSGCYVSARGAPSLCFALLSLVAEAEAVQGSRGGNQGRHTTEGWMHVPTLPAPVLVLRRRAGWVGPLGRVPPVPSLRLDLARSGQLAMAMLPPCS
jgi:hypothetical protein